jgi:tripartite-type tricarboxylate transporter receptor subunit TctC
MDRRSAISALGGLLLATLAGQARSQVLSGRTLRFVVGYPAGGVADFIARATTEGLKGTTAATVLVENRPGAGGNIALEYVARSGGDSGVFGAFSNSQITTNSFVPDLASKNVDAFKDLVPVIALVDMILVLAVSTGLGVKTLDQFLAKAKELGPRMRIGLAGVGTPHHLAALLIQRAAGLEMTMVPYKGGAPMIADAAGGHIDAVITTIPVGGPMVASGKLNWIAIVQPDTIASLPGVPSLAPILRGETIPTWNGIFAPASTPVAVLTELHAAMQSLLHSPAVSNKMRANGLEPLNLTRAETAARLANEAGYMKEFLSKVKLDFAT